MKKILKLPTDIHALKSIGIEQLHEVCWPVTDEEYFSLMRGYLDAFEEILLGLDLEHQLILIADFSFAALMAQVSHAKAVIGRIQEMGGSIEIGPLANSVYKPDWQELGLIEPNFSRGGRLAFRLRGLVKDLRFNNKMNLLRRFTGDGRVSLGLGSFSTLKGEYVRKRGIYVRNVYTKNLLPSDWKDSKAPQKIKSAAEDIVNRFGKVFASRFGFGLDLEDAAFVCWKKRLGALFSLYDVLRNRKGMPDEVLVTETALPLHKTVAAAFRVSGGRAVGFHHGNSMGGAAWEMGCYAELSAYDVFVCPTHGCAKAYAEDYAACTISRHLPVHIVATDSTYYERLHKSMASKSLPKSIKSVMLMGFPMNAIRYYGLPGYFFYYQIALELKLVHLLVSRGYRVLYKVHPECINAVLDLIGPICHEVIAEPFERCWEQADAFIFKQTASTTFGFALCTNRPIVLLDTERSFWREDHYNLIKRRCRMVPAHTESDGVMFDENVLIEVLYKKPETPDAAYIREFMYP
jgi:hypothetical protein